MYSLFLGFPSVLLDTEKCLNVDLLFCFFIFPAPSKTQFISLKPKIPLSPEVTHTKPGNYPKLFWIFQKWRWKQVLCNSLEQEFLICILIFVTFFSMKSVSMQWNDLIINSHCDITALLWAMFMSITEKTQKCNDVNDWELPCLVWQNSFQYQCWLEF